jgi:hypothetical protein
MPLPPKLPFWGLCLYIASQAYTVPIVAWGNWAVWPTPSDFAWLLFIALSLPSLFKGKPIDWGLLRVFLGILMACAASYAILSVYWRVLQDAGTEKSDVVGAYQLYRLVQFIVVFFLAAKVELSPERVKTLHWIAVAAGSFLCLTCIATYWVVPTSVFGGHLMSAVGQSGPWDPYIRGFTNWGVGASNYNHCFTGIQIILLAALAAHTRRPAALPPWFAMLCFLAIFISEHRTGLVFFVVYLLLLFRPSPEYLVSSAFALVLAAVIVAFTWNDVKDVLFEAVERHSTITTSYSTDGFAARDQIWDRRLDYLNEQPVRWIAGAGFGAASSDNAHNIFLHIIVETGVLGLAVFFLAMGKILQVLWWNEEASRPLFWATVCLMGTGFTQETFFPVASFGHFTGLYLCAVAIAIRSTDYTGSAEVLEPSEPTSIPAMAG